MSRAGVLSQRGDYYQILIATGYVLELLCLPDELEFIQVESIGIPTESEKILVDDIVIRFVDGRTRFIQAKKNQSDYRAWSLADCKEELRKAYLQLESCPLGEVEFVSRTPFGDLQKLAEECRFHSDFSAFKLEASEYYDQLLSDLSCTLKRSASDAFSFIRRCYFTVTMDFDAVERQHLARLNQLLPGSNRALAVLHDLILRHQLKIQSSKDILTRTAILARLAEDGIELAPLWDEQEIRGSFKVASSYGRHWQRDIAGIVIHRTYVDEVIAAIRSQRSILLQGGPGSGKTCILLDVVERIEQQADFTCLFIKADLFKEATTESDLANAGLPKDIVGRCSRLADLRRVVVVVDSLDVVSLSRHHRSLRVFLSIIDRLLRIQNLAVVAACREFDLKYDPLLRDRKWDKVIAVGVLEYESQVSPILQKLLVDPTTLSQSTRTLLQVPNNLKLYAALVTRGIVPVSSSMYELFDLFIIELIEKNEELGTNVTRALERMAEMQLGGRATTVHRSLFPLPEAIPALCSLDVLREASPGTLQFGHQTWSEIFSVRAAIANGQSLLEFIKDQPPFPFIRPLVRALFFYIRAQQPDRFRREVRGVLQDISIAYHLRRLVAESLAEVRPTDEDWQLVRFINDEHPELFLRLLWHVAGIEWFKLLKDRWLKYTRHSKTQPDAPDLVHAFQIRLSQWMNTAPVDVIRLWTAALSEGGAQNINLRWNVIISLDKFTEWKTPGTRQLLETLLSSHDDGQRELLGRPIGRFVEGTDSGDELLWKWVTCDYQPTFFLNDRTDLHCKPHELHSDAFFQNRMAASTGLLQMAIDSVELWSTATMTSRSDNSQLCNVFLHNTSWESQHDRDEYRAMDGLTILLNAIEFATQKHSRENSEWWQAHEKQLRSSSELALRYIHLNACLVNIGANAKVAEAVVTDERLLASGVLAYELGSFINRAYPYLSDQTVERSQRMLLAQIADAMKDVPVHSRYRSYGCQLLAWIPACYRLPETQLLLDSANSLISPSFREPRIYMHGGIVRPPFSAETLLSLSDQGIIDVLQYYATPGDHEDWSSEPLMGGTAEVLRELTTAAVLNPLRIGPLVSDLRASTCDRRFLMAALSGLANHIRHRSGHLSLAQGSTPLSSPPLTDLASELLRIIECLPTKTLRTLEAAGALLACAEVTISSAEAERIVFVLFGLLTVFEPSWLESNSDGGLLTAAINSIQGVSAEAAYSIFNRFMELGIPLPTLLPAFLCAVGKKATIPVRGLILQLLPYAVHKNPELAWPLFAEALSEPEPQLWPFAERVLFYQYEKNYGEVSKWLVRLKKEAPPECMDIWARLTALCCLAGHITMNSLCSDLSEMQSKFAWCGAAQVFVANLFRRDSAQLCESGILYVLESQPSAEVINHVERMFFESNYQEISCTIVRAYLKAIAPAPANRELYDVLGWLAYFSLDNPREAVEILQSLIDVLASSATPVHLLRKDSLLQATASILRDADESDDPDFIAQAIKVYDGLLRLNIYEMDDLLDLAAAP